MPILGFIAALLAAVFGLLGGSQASTGSGTSTEHLSASTIVVSQNASGHTVTAPRDVPVEIHLSHRWRWGTPRVGKRAGLQRIDFVADPGYDAWLVQPRGPGNVVVQATGRPGPRRFRLTIHVR